MCNYGILLFYITSTLLSFTLCNGWDIKLYHFEEPNHNGNVSSELNPLSCARAANKGKSCGCKMSIHDKMYDTLWKDDWYENPEYETTYKYMETDKFIYWKPLLQPQPNGNWLFTKPIPMCMNPQSVVEIKLTLKQNWTTMRIFLRKDAPRPLMIVIKENIPTQFEIKSVIYSPTTYPNQEIVTGVLFQAEKNYVLKIKVLETTFQVFINNALVHEFNPNMTDITIDQIAVNVNNPGSRLHYIQFRQSDF